METIFKSALNHIHAEEPLKQKVSSYLVKTLSSASVTTQVRAKNPLMKRVIAVACSAVFVCAASFGAYAYYKTPISYLSLDINPSVELGVNAFGRVVSAVAYNNDGKTILDGQNVMDSGVKDAVSTLVKSAAQKGFIAKDGSTVIAVTSETDNSSTAENLEDAAAQGADSAVKSEGETAAVQKENVALDRRDEARKLGITPGKLNLIQKLQALDPTITVDEYKEAKVTDIMKKFVELKKETLSQQNSDANSGTSSSAGTDANSVSSEKTDSTSSPSQAGNGKSNQNGNKDNSSSATSSVSSSSQSTQSANGNNGNGSDNANSHADNSNKKK